ncbi:hypothetical protein, partial [Streptomyces sp. Tue6028]|uniref:hypothetical protein n=1 Tax=Streptomyces sp. Tue6028 TaxID=2036037 RepID=UPI003D75FFA8
MGTSPDEEQRGEIELRNVGRAPTELDTSVPQESRRLAELLRVLMFGPLREHGFGYREISGALGNGYSPATVSAVSRASRLPSFVELTRLIALAEEKTGRKLSPARQQELQIAHLKALEADGSHLPELFMAENACQAYQVECARAQSAEGHAKDELLQAHRLIGRANRAEARAVSVLARSQQNRDRQASRLAETQKILQRVQDDLATQKAVLGHEILRLRSACARARTRRQQAEKNAATAQRKLAHARERLLQEVADREAVAEELAVVAATLQQVRKERDVLKEAEELRGREASVLADADAAVRKAERDLSQEQVLIGAEGSVGGPEPVQEDEEVQSDRLLQAALFAPEAELADLLAELAEDGDDDAAAFVLSTAAARPGSEVAALIQILGEAGYWPHRNQLFQHAAQQPAEAVAELLRVLERADAPTEMGLLFDSAALADVASLLHHLFEVEQRVYAARLLDAAVRRRSAADVAGLLLMLDQEGRQQEADGLIKDAATYRTPRDILRLIDHAAAMDIAERYIRVAIETAAQRTPKAVVTLSHALVSAGKGSLAAGLLGHTAGGPLEAVAETAALIASDHPHGEEVGWLLVPFVQQRPEQLWQMVSHVATRSPAVTAALLKEIGTSTSPDLLVELVLRTADFLPLVMAGQDEEAVDIVLGHAALRPTDQVLSLVHLLSEHRRDLADALVRQVARIPTESAVGVIAGLLGDDSEAPAVLALVATGSLCLRDLLTLARGLYETGHRGRATSLLRRAGTRSSFSASEVALVFHPPLPGWMALALLEGAATRHDDLVTDLVVEFYRHGLHPYVQMLLCATSTEAGTVVPLAVSLWDHDLFQDAFWLVGRFAETASADELALAFSLASDPLISELILQVVQGPGGRGGRLVEALSRRQLVHAALAVLSEGRREPGSWAHACSAVLERFGRSRQAQWLAMQRDDLADGYPPAETAQEAAWAFSHFRSAGQETLAEEILLATVKGAGDLRPHHILQWLPEDDTESVREIFLARLPDLSDADRSLLRHAGLRGWPVVDPTVTLVTLPALG